MLGEMAKVSVARHERHFVIDARLCNQGIGHSRFEPVRQDATACLARALPIAVAGFELKECSDYAVQLWSRFGIAQQFRDDNRGEPQAAVVDRGSDCSDIRPGPAFKVGYENRCVGGNHRRS